MPAPVPYAPGQYVDPANGRLVRPVPGPWAIDRQPWEYAEDSTEPPGTQPPGTQPSGTQPSGTLPSGTQPSGAANPPLAPSGQAPVPFTGPIPTGRQRPMVDPANGRVVLPVTGVYPPGQPWPYVYADGS